MCYTQQLPRLKNYKEHAVPLKIKRQPHYKEKEVKQGLKKMTEVLAAPTAPITESCAKAAYIPA